MISQDRLKEVLSYDAGTGIFIWLQGVCKGKIAGCTRRDKYVVIRLDWKLHLVHRLAWLYVHGEFPDFYIDHIDGNPNNNKISNLREATQSANMQNQRKLRKDSTSGYTGVSFDKRVGKWESYIQVEKKKIRLGHFNSLELARDTYLEKKKELHPFSTLETK